MLDLQRFSKQWIVAEIYLADRQIIGGAPVRVEQSQLVFRHHEKSPTDTQTQAGQALEACINVDSRGTGRRVAVSSAISGMLARRAFSITATSMIS